MPPIKVSGDCFHASRGRGGFFYLHQFTCFQLSWLRGGSSKLPCAQSGGRGGLLLSFASDISPPLTTLPTPKNTSSFLVSVPWVVFALLCSSESRRLPLPSVHGNYRNFLKAVPCGSRVQPLKSSSRTLGKKVGCVSLRSLKKIDSI